MRSLVMPLASQDPLVCPVCRAFIHELDESSELCDNCSENTDLLGVDAVPVLPVTLYIRESETRTWITHYKPDVDEQHGEPAVSRDVCIAVMRMIVGEFFISNSWIFEGIDHVLVVPSTRRPPPHPLEQIVGQSSAAGLLIEGALTRTQASLDHRKANPLAYEGSRVLEGKRVLLVDDVYASGARLQSAAIAARRAGADVERAVAVARRINPNFHEVIAAKWQEATRLPFSWERRS